jgi:hypothetical protein
MYSRGNHPAHLSDCLKRLAALQAPCTSHVFLAAIKFTGSLTKLAHAMVIEAEGQAKTPALVDDFELKQCCLEAALSWTAPLNEQHA